MDSVLDLIEKRIENLELQVLPKNYTNSENKSQSTITDLLLQTQTMIVSALNCREAITSILQHMTTINEYLDPSHGENELEIEARRQYLLELYPELQNTIKLISTFESLTPFIDSENISKVTQLSEKLEELAVINLNVYEESRKVTNSVLNALQQYNDITTSIKILFLQLDKAISEVELALQPKFATEE